MDLRLVEVTYPAHHAVEVDRHRGQLARGARRAQDQRHLLRAAHRERRQQRPPPAPHHARDRRHQRALLLLAVGVDRVAIGALGDHGVGLGQTLHVHPVQGALGRHRVVAQVQDTPNRRVDEQHGGSGDVAGVHEAHRDSEVGERRDRLCPLDRPHPREGALDHLGRVERRLPFLREVLGLHDAHTVGEQQARQEQGRLRAVDRGQRKHLGGKRQGAGVVDVRVRHQDGLRRLDGQPIEGGQAILPDARGGAHPRVDEHAPVPDP